MIMLMYGVVLTTSQQEREKQDDGKETLLSCDEDLKQVLRECNLSDLSVLLSMEEEELPECEVRGSTAQYQEFIEQNSNQKPDGYLNELEERTNDDTHLNPWNVEFTGENSSFSSPFLLLSQNKTIPFQENDAQGDKAPIKMACHQDSSGGNNLDAVLSIPQAAMLTCYKTENEEVDESKNEFLNFPALPSILSKEVTVIEESDEKREKLPVMIPFCEDLSLKNSLPRTEAASIICQSKNEEQKDDNTNDCDIDVRSLAMGLPPIPSIPSESECSMATIKTTSTITETATFSLESLPPIPFPRTFVDVPSQGLPSSSSNRTKARCKHGDCKWYGDVSYGGYCSDCFMCLTIEENSAVEESSFNSAQLGKQLCLGKGCEFFGATEYDGYCSQCHNKQKRLVDEMSNTTSGWCRDDMKMCIICLQLPYNTVLLPCGHLYLCFHCASSIKNKNGTCPACRTTIRSFHRVYTPD